MIDEAGKCHLQDYAMLYLIKKNHAISVYLIMGPHRAMLSPPP